MSFIWNRGSGGGGRSVDTLTGNSGGAVGASALYNINILGSGAIAVTGNPGTNTLTISDTGGGLPWTVITVNQTAVINNGYITNKASTLTLLLPATAAIGSVIRVTGINTATGWSITQNANQQIFFGSSSTTIGVTGSLTSTAIRDSVELVCVVAGASTVWNVISSIGSPTIT